ncbi:hypothetical protein D9Q98_008441 [Chlorella vulgaris]|uniref:S1 motif domain-containing protein n=1 Tax=Chlorella vulgaris TaxID=3077 RepID=A0A9D4YTE8_CHLVU|nr:hypothetical protein D9Q98_008441 [Chlorella vulgaris]
MAGASDLVDDRAGEAEEKAPAGAAADEEDDGLPSDEEEASEGSDDEGDSDSDDSSAEGEDEEDAFEKDDFIVDEADDDGDKSKEGSGSDVEGAAEAKKRRKPKRQRDLVLDEEDYELLEDNTGIRRQRPQQKHRRIKKARDAEAAPAQQQDAARALQEELFGAEEELEDDDDDFGRPSAAAAAAKGGAGGAGRGPRGDSRQGGGMRDEAPPPEADDQFDEEDDWLVHEEDEDGGVAAGQRRRRRKAAMEGMPDVSPDALVEANEIFGDVDDLLAMYEDRERDRHQGGGRAHGGEGEEEDADLEDEEEEELDGEAAEARRLAREERQRAAATRRAQAHLDPEAVARHFMLPEDEQIRLEDVPEREQLHRGPDPKLTDLPACAAWVWDHLMGERRRGGRVSELLEDGVQEVQGPPPAWYGRPTWSKRDLREEVVEVGGHRALFVARSESREERRAWRRNAAAQAELRACIEKVLRQVYDKHEEVPFVAQYRKELCGELLVVRPSDEPKVVRAGEDNGRYPRGTIKPTHRRIRRFEVLYAVQQLAQRWRAMQVRREARRQAYGRALSETMHSGEQAAIQSCLALLEKADSMEELDDCEAKFKLIQQQFALEQEAHQSSQQGGGPEEPLSQLSLGSGGSGPRRPQKSTPYLLSLRAGLGGWARGLGLTAVQLAENVEAGYLKHKHADVGVSPEEFIKQFVTPSGVFSSPEGALKGGRLVAAAEIAAEPLLRQEVRKQYQELACVWTKPTAAGESSLDPFHPLASVKRLHEKPLERFETSDQFLRLLQAEKAGLIEVRFGFRGEEDGEGSGGKQRAAEQEEGEEGSAEGHTKQRGGTLLANLADNYLSGGISVEAAAWDKVRRQVLREAVTDFLMPQMEREARTRLAAAARSVALEEAADRLWAYASQAPLQLKLVDDEEVEGERRVMAVCYGGGDPATTFVMLDPQGNLVDYLHCPQFSGPIPRRKAVPGLVYSVFEDPKKAQDAARVRAFIEDHKPHAIVVGASHPEARTLELDLGLIREAIVLDNPRYIIELGTGELQILMADESVAAVWENSAAARDELLSATPAPIVRRGVALGRQLLDPLALLASLCGGGGKEVLALQLHPLQSQIPEEERLAMVDRVMVTATSQIGVDINAVAASSWLSAPLPFTPGLGPRKAQALLRAVGRAGGFVESRNQMWLELGVFGNRVFRNAAPFLRVRASVKGAANLDMDPLDDTRMHPEAYQWAVQMAQSAVGAGEEEQETAVENAFARPQEVESLDIVFYAQHLQQQAAAATEGDQQQQGEGGEGKDALAGVSRLPTLIDIQMEFAAPYGELRKELAPLKTADLFFLCAGETKESLKKGRRVEARVRHVGDSDARCVLPDLNNIEAVLQVEDMSRRAAEAQESQREAVSMRDYLQPNDTVAARIIDVLPDQWQVRLSTRGDVVADDAAWEAEYLAAPEGNYYRLPPKEDPRAALETQRRKRLNQFVARPIQHPLFKNLSMADAAAQLQEPGVPVGQAIVRPSTRGAKGLWLTMKLPDGIWHLYIEEQGKSSASMKLGSSLVMEVVPQRAAMRGTYEDLDELAARFVDPVQAHLGALTAHRKWRGESWERAKELLRLERQRSPQTAAYCLGQDSSKGGGIFFLGHVLRTTPDREYFMVTPDGFYFRQKVYPSVDALLAAFRKNPKKPNPQAPPPPAEARPPLPGVPHGMAAGQGAPPPPGSFYPGGQQQQQQQAGHGYGGYGQQQQPPMPPPQYGGWPGQQQGGYGYQQQQGTGGYPAQQAYPPQPQPPPQQQGWGGQYGGGSGR